MRLFIYAVRDFSTLLTIEDIDVALKKFKLKPLEVLTLTSCASPDDIGYCWAEAREIPITSYEIDWNPYEGCKGVKKNRWGKEYNPRAGFERNEKIVNNSDGILVFWSETSRDVEDIMNQAKKVDLPIYYAKPNPEYVLE